MAESTIEEKASELGVSPEDVKPGKCRKFWQWLIHIAIAVILFLIGFFVGGGGATCPTCAECPPCPPDGNGGGYPYAAAVILPQMLDSKKSKKTKLAIVLGSALAFFIAMKAAPVFGQAILYNVYEK